MDNVNAEGSVETPKVEELLSQLKKAEAKIVEMKKGSDTKTEETPPDDKKEEVVDLDKKISDLLDVKLSALKEGKEKDVDDKYNSNQNISNSMSITDNDARINNSNWLLNFTQYKQLSRTERASYCSNNKDSKWSVIYI